MGPDQFVQLGHAPDAVGDSPFAQDVTGFAHHADVVMIFSPVHTYENHYRTPLCPLMSPEEFSGDLMISARGTTPQQPSVSSPADRGTL